MRSLHDHQWSRILRGKTHLKRQAYPRTLNHLLDHHYRGAAHCTLPQATLKKGGFFILLLKQKQVLSIYE